MKLTILLALTTLAVLPATRAAAADDTADFSQVPGVVVNHSPASAGKFIGSPSILILDDGTYLASHDEFGPGGNQQTKGDTLVFRSADRGQTWEQIAVVPAQYWSTLFQQGDAVYMIGTRGEYGNLSIRKSADKGRTWTTASDAKHGLLENDGAYHCAPQPIVRHNGRIWRAMEDAQGPGGWGSHFRAFMMSVPEDADLLDRANWTFSDRMARDPAWLDGRFGGWLEGNAVVTPDGGIVDILRVDDAVEGDVAAIITYDAEGKTSHFNADNRSFGDKPADAATILKEGGLIHLPGGNKKFLIRQDPQEPGSYWMIANVVPPKHHTGNLGKVRNTLSLLHSDNLVDWEERCRLLYHPDVLNHGFQYPDWVYDGDDLALVLRTAYDDGLGGAHNYHDANFLTFMRVKNFRDLAMKDSVPMDELPPTKLETSAVSVAGTNIEPATLKNGERAFSNRPYVWAGVPAKMSGARYTRTGGGVTSTIKVKAKTDSDVYAATGDSVEGKSDLTGWQKVPGATFAYSDPSRTPMQVYRRSLKAGQEIDIPQGSWQGMIVILPAE